MKQIKKIIATIMSIILLISATPVLFASAQPYDDNLEHYQSGMWEYTLEDGEACITGLYPEEKLTGTVAVPETLDGYPVTEIDWIYYGDDESQLENTHIHYNAEPDQLYSTSFFQSIVDFFMSLFELIFSIFI